MLFRSDLGWQPSEFKVRDLTKDSKKQNLSYQKRVEALDRWLEQTFTEEKYKDSRLSELEFCTCQAACSFQCKFICDFTDCIPYSCNC